MQGAADFIVDFLQLNEEIPFQTVFAIILLYIILLWLVISIWVFIDARKRYDNDMTPVLFGFLVFFLNFPMLIFYFAVRPEIRFDDFDDWEAGGVNVPIVNFMGKDGIEMSFELRVNPKKIGYTEKKNDMVVEIGWDKQDERFRLIDREELANQIIAENEQIVKKPVKKSSESNLLNIFEKTSGFVKRRVFQLRNAISNVGKGFSRKPSVKKSKEEPKREVTNVSLNDSVQLTDASMVSSQNKQHKKKKKNRR